MVQTEHKGIDFAGIIITYIMSSVIILVLFESWIDWGYLLPNEVLALLLSITTLTLTILYHINKIQNYILVGIFGILVSVIGGIFILIGQSNVKKANPIESENNIGDLEYQLRKLDNIFEKGVLTKEEYDMKRKSIIEKY